MDRKKATVIDPHKWEELTLSLGSDLPEIVELFIQDASDYFAQIDEAFKDNDFATIQRLAHSLKSSSGIFGAYAMMDGCKNLENAAEMHAPDLIDQAEELKNTFNQVTRDLRGMF
jgi:HPt (histidine-containing phosphotransfer) domain-containing protein